MCVCVCVCVGCGSAVTTFFKETETKQSSLRVYVGVCIIQVLAEETTLRIISINPAIEVKDGVFTVTLKSPSCLRS